MTILPFRPHTRAALLSRMNSGVVFLEVGVKVVDVELPDESNHNYLADVRDGAPLDQCPRHDPLPLYQRSRESVVWHWRTECPGHPGEWCITLQGEPALGMKCRRCAAIGIPRQGPWP